MHLPNMNLTYATMNLKKNATTQSSTPALSKDTYSCMCTLTQTLMHTHTHTYTHHTCVLAFSHRLRESYAMKCATHS